jgi:hypothetical protein
MPLNEILMEIQQIGAVLRVSAIDADSGMEVVFQAPSSTSHADIQRLAASKLKYVLRKEAKAKGRYSKEKGGK